MNPALSIGKQKGDRILFLCIKGLSEPANSWGFSLGLLHYKTDRNVVKPFNTQYILLCKAVGEKCNLSIFHILMYVDNTIVNTEIWGEYPRDNDLSSNVPI